MVSISTAAIPSTRFRVPAEPVAAALVREHQEAVRTATISAAPTAEDRQRAQDRFIKRAFCASDRLWLLTKRGTLSSVVSGETNRRAETTPGLAADICVARAAPVILSADGQLARLENRSWHAVQRLELNGEAVQALSCTDQRVIAVGQAMESGATKPVAA